MSVEHYLVIALVGAVVTFLVTPIVRRFALAADYVHHPGHRDVHTRPVVRLGGIAIFAGVMAAIATEAAGERFFGWSATLLDAGTSRTRALGVIIGLILIFLTGLLDDFRPLSPGWKLAGELLAAGVVVASGLRIEYIGNPMGGGLVQLGLLSIPITLVYIVAFTNVINLIDGLDGLAAGVSAIAAVTLLVLAAQGNRFDAAVLAAALIGACVAFLRYNFHPASIIMGDSGALFLGFALSTISLMGVMKSTAAIALAVPLFIVGVPIFDTASAIIRRALQGKPIQEADRGHIHHRLLGRGFTQTQTVLIIYAWCIALAFGGYTVRWSQGPVKWIAFVSLFAVTGVMAYWLGLFEAVHHVEEEDVLPAQRPRSKRQRNRT
ncbi:MAG: undecaprenyl/decaprenyl-phosphate alpha-N-acetylglucosaminyl 1-phosphate transferase [Coriobacteriia bacterium]|nr:undecaprenyl/decaprenyl-phosphate alpha-N-acetylglucosaminyl 1-phosphate transferase [Coriobacteriia bacterium]